MSKSEKVAWVVLVDKNPLGPFSEEEIRGQLSDGKLRPNDIAFRVEAGQTGPGSEWKFLWQFGEFERRKAADLPAEPNLNFFEDRRNEKSEAEVRRSLLAELPTEFISLPTLVAEALPPEPGQSKLSGEGGPSLNLERRDYAASAGNVSGLPRISSRSMAVYALCALVAGIFVWKLATGFNSTPAEESRKIASDPKPAKKPAKR